MSRSRFAKRPYGMAASAVAAFAFLLVPESGRASLDRSKAITQYVHQSWQTEAGLPENSVYTMAQTPDGYLWLGAEGGLVRFDGLHFTVLNSVNTPGLPADLVTALRVDHNGVLWIGTGNGLVSLSKGTFRRFKLGPRDWRGK